MEEGNYYLLTVTDVEEQVAELNENNNVFALPFRIFIGAKDFSIAELRTDDQFLYPGSSLRLNVVEKIRPYSPCAHNTAFFLSADSVYSDNDQYLHADIVYSSDTVTRKTWQPVVDLPIPLAAGNYYIVAVADFGNACVQYIEDNNTKALAIQVLPDFTTSILSGDTKNPMAMRIYPNPSTGICKLGSSEGIDRVEVCDVHGKYMLSIDINAGHDLTLNLTDLEAGVYMVKVLSDTSTVGHQRLVIAK